MLIPLHGVHLCNRDIKLNTQHYCTKGIKFRSKFDLSTPKTCEVRWRTLWISSVSSTKRCQETWVAKRYQQNVTRSIQETRFTDSPLIHVMFSLWHRLDEIRVHHLRQHPVLNSPELFATCHAFMTAFLQLPVWHPKDSTYGTQLKK